MLPVIRYVSPVTCFMLRTICYVIRVTYYMFHVTNTYISPVEVEKENVGLFVIVHGGSPIMNCLHKLGLTGESCLESMMVMDDNVVSIEVFLHVDKGDMLHHRA